MDRRSYISATVGLLTAGSAGCLRLSAEETSTETPSGGATSTPIETSTRVGRERDSESDGQTETEPDNPGTVPEWASWFPATTLDGPESDVFAIDTDRAVDEFPDDELNLVPAKGTDLDYEDLSRSVSVHHENDAGPKMYRGSFDCQELLNEAGVDESETTSYRDFTIAHGETGFTESVLLQNDPYGCLDAKFGQTASLGTVDPDWERLLSATAGSTMLIAGKGDIIGLSDIDFSAEVQATARTVDAIDKNTAKMRVYVLFDGESTASTVRENHADELVDAGSSYYERPTETSRLGRLLRTSYEGDHFFYEWTDT